MGIRKRATRCSWILALVLLLATGASGEVIEDETPGDSAEPVVVSRTDEFEFEEDDDDLLEEIVVTARKRRELLQDTPVSVTVLNGRDLERQGVTSLEQLAPYVPNLSIWEGVQGAGTLYSRGVGQRDSLVSLDPGVGLYVDDAYVSRAQGALLATVDVERVEVLRGPQGTLYGKNTIGGAVKVLTRKPGPDPQVAGSFTAGNYHTIQSTAMFNLPVVDDLLYTRFNFASRDARGYNRNRFLGEDENDDNLLAFRGQIRLLPAEDLTFDLGGHYSRERERGKAAKCLVSNAALPGLLPAPQNVLFTQLHADCDAANTGDAHEFVSNLDDRYHLESYGASLTGLWDLGPMGGLDHLELKSVTSLREQIVDEGGLDLDATQSTVVDLGIAQVPLAFEQRMLSDQKQSQASHELQLNATALDDRLELTGGFYGFWERTDGGNVESNNLGTLRLERIEIANASYAGYTQTSYAPWDWLELTAGLRFTYEDKEADRRIVSGASPAETPFETDQKDFQQWTPMAGVAVSIPERLLDGSALRSGIAYFTYAQGWKSGGFSTRRNPALFSLSDFDAEEVDNFELGFKIDAFDSRLLINTAFFYSLYRDMQLTVQRVNPLDPTDIGSAIANAGRATIWGFEIESVIRPTQDLIARIGLGLTDAKYNRFRDNGVDRSSEALFNIPKWNLSALAEYTFDFERIGLASLGTLVPAASLSFQSDTDTHFTNAGYRTGLFRQDAFAILDLRLGWQLADDRTEFNFFVNNVTGEDYFLSSIDLTNTVGLGARYYGAPRSFGGTVSYRWDAFGWGAL